jgi:hypothetical protein
LISKHKVDLVVLAFLSFLAFVVSHFSTRNLIVLNDARELYASQNYFGMNSFDLARFFFFPQDYSRLFSAGIGRLLGIVCGPERICLNTFNSFLLVLIVAVGFLYTLLLTKNLTISGIVVFLWILSAPVLNSILWQATQHDKLATLLFFTTALTATVIFRASIDSFFKQLAFSFLLTFLLAISFNTKETNFILPIVLFTIAFVEVLKKKVVLRRLLIILSFPTLYSIWYISYFLTHMSSGISSHSFNGNIVETSNEFLKQFLNLGNFMYLSEYSTLNMFLIKNGALLYLFGGSIFCIYLLLFFYRIAVNHFLRETFFRSSIFLLIPLVTLLCCLVGILRTEVPTAFYLLIPSWALILLFVQFSSLMGAFERGKKIILKLGISFVCFAYISTFLVHFNQNGVVTKLNASSRILQESFDYIGQLRPQDSLVLVLEDANSYGIWYLLMGATSDADKWLSPYIFQDKKDFVNLSLRFGNFNCSTTPQATCVYLDSNYNILKIAN